MQWHFTVVSICSVVQGDDIHYPLGQPQLRHGRSLSAKQAARACTLPSHLAEVTYPGWWHPLSTRTASAKTWEHPVCYSSYIVPNRESPQPCVALMSDMLYVTFTILSLQMSNVFRTSKNFTARWTAIKYNWLIDLTPMGHMSLISLWHHTSSGMWGRQLWWSQICKGQYNEAETHACTLANCLLGFWKVSRVGEL